MIGGYAVAVHGYIRTTNDLDIWIRASPANAAATVLALREFGYLTPDLTEHLFLEKGTVVRMGVPPLRLELLTSIAGVDFDECYRERIQAQIGDVTVQVISLERLLQNKKAAGRAKDLADLENLSANRG